MATKAIYNHRGFFSDYWLGTLLSQRQYRDYRLTPAQARNRLKRLSRLIERVDRPAPLDLTNFRERFARPLLEDLLDWRILPQTEDGRPRLRLLTPHSEPEETAIPRAMLVLIPETEHLDESTRQAEKALIQTRLDYAILLSPAALRLIRVRGEGARNAALDLSLVQTVAEQDSESLQAATMVFSAAVFQPDASGIRPIDHLEDDNRRHKSKVSEELKPAVFQAAELVVAGFLEDQRHRPDTEQPDADILALRDASLQLLYRLLFILYAESRDERLAAHPLYWASYSLDMLIGRLLGTALEDLPANRFGLWHQIQALFSIYNDGLPALPGMGNIPPRGGRLFSTQTPEGALIRHRKLADRTVAKLLLTLATTSPRRGVGRERISFRELEIEQLGSVYEGLLEYEPAIATETLIHISSHGQEYTLAPEELIRLCAEKDLRLKGPATLVQDTPAAALHPEWQPEDEDPGPEDNPDADTADAEDSTDAPPSPPKGAIARLLRRFEPGDFFFKPGSARKASGSYYTPSVMVDHLVKGACAHIPENATPETIENLRVIDLACGSGHFLVGAARHLGAMLHAAYLRQSSDPPPAFHPRRDLTAAVRREWEQLGPAWCKRRIVERCLFGVDLNPTAVQLAQIALWIESLAGDRPLSFFEHHIRCGNSLLGTWRDRLHRAPIADWDNKALANTVGLFEGVVDRSIAEALTYRNLIAAPMDATQRADTKDEYDYKADRMAEAGQILAHARLLFDLRSAAAFLPAIWKAWTALVNAGDLETLARSCDWWPRFETIRARKRFFHWELEFPEVFSGQRPGFDVILGNPPWEKIKPDRKEFYGGSDVLIRAYTGGALDVRIRELHKANPGLADQFAEYSQRMQTTSLALKKGGDYKHVDWTIAGKTTGGDADLFKFFVERAHRVLREGGRMGYLVPGAIYNNEGCTGLRHLLLDQARIRDFYAFENRLKIFPIDSRYKFVLLVAEKVLPENQDPSFHATFMRHDPDELADPPAQFQVLLKKSELQTLSPGTLAFLEYRTPRDHDIVRKMYGLLPGQTPRPLLGDQGSGTWNAKFSTEFHMTQDRALWTKPNGKLWTPKEVCGLDWPADSSIPFAEVRAAMDAKGFWPLYEGKMIEQFLTGIAPVARWLHVEAATKKYKRPPDPNPKLVFRDIASNTNERTCIAAVLPHKSGFGHTLSGLSVSIAPEKAMALLNSFVFDYAVRLRTGGTHLSFTFMSRMPILVDIPGETLTTSCAQNLKVASISQSQSMWLPVWRLNRSIAEAYGLDADDFSHVLSTFPGVANKRREFHLFLREQIESWKAEK